MRRITQLDWARLADVLIAAGLLLPSTFEIWVHPIFGSHVHGPRWLNWLLVAGFALPALWRRSHPEVSFAVFTFCWSAFLLGLYPTATNTPGDGWFAMLLAWFSFGVYARGRNAKIAGALGAAGFGAVMLSQLVGGVTPSEVLPNWIFPLGAWLLGRLLGRRERRRGEDAAEAVALERSRIARELHDVISHSVSVIVMQASVERRLLGNRHPQYSETLLGIERAGRDALGELRALLDVLGDGGETELSPQPGLSQLETLVAGVRAAGLPVDLRTEGTPHALPPGVELAAYRLVQEGLTNVLKHARAEHASVVVRFAPGSLGIELADDGHGPNGGEPGRGLTGLRRRLALYGGDLETFAPAEGGFVLRSRIPVAGTSA